MQQFTTKIEVRWSDLDPNFHLRHSVYYDLGALSRVEFFTQHGLTTELMNRLNFGPILFREECVFRKEIRLGDQIIIDLRLIKSKRNFSRWTIKHTITKNGDIVAATIIVDGAWIDTIKRKLAVLPAEISALFKEMPVDENFQWLD